MPELPKLHPHNFNFSYISIYFVSPSLFLYFTFPLQLYVLTDFFPHYGICRITLSKVSYSLSFSFSLSLFLNPLCFLSGLSSGGFCVYADIHSAVFAILCSNAFLASVPPSFQTCARLCVQSSLLHECLYKCPSIRIYDVGMYVTILHTPIYAFIHIYSWFLWALTDAEIIRAPQIEQNKLNENVWKGCEIETELWFTTEILIKYPAYRAKNRVRFIKIYLFAGKK